MSGLDSNIEIDTRYRTYIDGIIISLVRRVAIIAIIIYMAFNCLDWIVYPDRAFLFLKIRAGCAVLILTILSFSFWKKVQPWAVWLADVMGLIGAAGILLMIHLSDGSSSHYYEGINLVFLGVGIMNASYPKHNFYSFPLMIICYELAACNGSLVFNKVNFYSANFYMIATAILVSLMTVFHKNQHYKAFVRQEQLKIKMNEIEKAEKALQEQARELARSNKDLEQFAYTASHDLQEPLRMVASFCQKLEKQYKDKLDTNANEYIYFAVDGAKRMQLLVDALLSYARVGKKDVEIQEVDLNKVIKTILHDLDAVIKTTDATINVGQLPVIMANGIQMSQLFQNLLTNALKFKGERKPIVEIRSTKEKDGFEFVISDNGIGIDEKHFPKMFAIFHRLHERGNYPGTGIGLALCKKIVENFNGKIWVTSRVGEGTTFHFILNVKEVN